MMCSKLLRHKDQSERGLFYRRPSDVSMGDREIRRNLEWS